MNKFRIGSGLQNFHICTPLVKRLHFSNILDLDFTLKKILDCGWTWTEF